MKRERHRRATRGDNARRPATPTPRHRHARGRPPPRADAPIANVRAYGLAGRTGVGAFAHRRAAVTARAPTDRACRP
ncbi:putative glutamine amidotransferase [Burkholderia mallei GB8 horse 4]|nr:putative glutamine amidotransferase [Burkholderia mallei GB8 horse 4]